MNAPEPTRILIVDDHPVVREGLRHLLSHEPDFHVVGDAASGEQAVEAAALHRPHVVLMDLVMPGTDGAEATRRILAGGTETRVLILTGYGAEDKLFPAIKAGAVGFLLKDATGADLARAIRRAARGESTLCPAMARRLMQRFADEPLQEGAPERLTERETEVLRRIAEGLSNDEIAGVLGISAATVRTHVTHILAKLHLTRRTQAALYALRHGIAGLGEDQPGS